MNDAPDLHAMPAKLGELTFGQSQAIAIRSLEDAWRLSTLLIKAQMVPAGIDTIEKACVAILYGAELGLSPLMAVQKVTVINNKPTVFGEAALAIIRRSGLLEDIDEGVIGEGDDRHGFCTVTRKGEREKTSTFSIGEAKQAGLWDERETVKRKDRNGAWYEKSNDAPWKRFPDRLLLARARGFRLRDSFSDLLAGLFIREELIGGEIFDGELIEREPPTPPRRAMEPPTPPTPPDVHETDQDRTPEEIRPEILDKNNSQNSPPEPPVTKQYVDDNAGGPPEPPEPPAAPAKLDPIIRARFLGEYAERLQDVQTEAALDALWNDHVLPMIDADRLDDETLEALQRADDERRGLIQTHGGESDR